MLYDFSIESDCRNAITYMGKLIDSEAKAELVKISSKRTSSQNRYVHALFYLFGVHFGYTTDEAKVVVKRALGYIYKKGGHWFLEHTSEMDTKELSEFTDKFRNYSAHEGFYLPSPEEFQENYVKMMSEVRYVESQMTKYGSV